MKKLLKDWAVWILLLAPSAVLAQQSTEPTINSIANGKVFDGKKQSDLTGSVASVSPNLIKQSPVSSFDRILQGAVAGVQVIQTSGQPGSAVSIRIRGGNSITGGNEPLYVIDGFPVYNDNSDANA